MSNKPNVSFKFPTSLKIGTGHLVRCRTLAEHFIDNWNINFDTSNEGYKLLSDLQGVTFKKVQDIKNNLIVLDDYSTDINDEKVLQCYTEKLLVIDDIPGRIHKCDYFLDHTSISHSLRKSVVRNNNCTFFLGLDYLILRNEFKMLQNKKKVSNSLKKNILIYFGSTDPKNITSHLLKEIINHEKSLSHLNFTIVIGLLNPHRNMIRELSEKIPAATLIIQAENMAELIFNSDLAISSGGNAIWERIALRTPSIEVSHTDNQIYCLEQLHEKNLVYYLGDFNYNTIEKIVPCILKYFENKIKISHIKHEVGYKVSEIEETIRKGMKDEKN